MRLVAAENIVQALLAAPKLVAQRQSEKRGVIAELIKNTEALFDKILLPVGDLLLNSAPERQLRLHVDAQHIRRTECGIGRTAGVETVVIDPMLLCGFHDLEPALGVGGSCACKGEYHAVMLSTKIDFLAVQQEIALLRRVFMHTEYGLGSISSAGYFQCICKGIVFIPEPCIRHFICELTFAAYGIFSFGIIACGDGYFRRFSADNCSFYGYTAAFYIGKYPDIVKAQLFSCFNIYFTCDPKPVGLGVGRCHMAAGDRAGDIVDNNGERKGLVI